MSYIATIVNFINAQLEAGFLKCSAYDDKKVVGLAQILPRMQEENKLEYVPSVVDNEGNAEYIGPEDDNDIIIYHRCTGITVGKAILKTFGDNKPMDSNIAKMCLVVFGRRDHLQMTNYELAIYIQAAFPEAATKEILGELQFRAANINISEIILNDLQVFSEEFTNVVFFLKPDQFLFKVNYTIESAFLKACFTNECD